MTVTVALPPPQHRLNADAATFMLANDPGAIGKRPADHDPPAAPPPLRQRLQAPAFTPPTLTASNSALSPLPPLGSTAGAPTVSASHPTASTADPHCHPPAHSVAGSSAASAPSPAHPVPGAHSAPPAPAPHPHGRAPKRSYWGDEHGIKYVEPVVPAKVGTISSWGAARDDGNTDEPVTATPVSPSAAACASAAAPSLTLASNAMHESHGAMGRRGVTPPPPPSYTTLPTPAFRAAYEDALFGTSASASTAPSATATAAAPAPLPTAPLSSVATADPSTTAPASPTSPAATHRANDSPARTRPASPYASGSDSHLGTAPGTVAPPAATPAVLDAPAPPPLVASPGLLATIGWPGRSVDLLKRRCSE